MDLSLIKSKLQSLQPKPKQEKVDYTKIYYKPQPGKHQIRIVPSKLDKTSPFKEIYFHYGFTKYPILALNNWGEADPILELVQQLRKERDPENWKLAKKLEAKMRIFVPVVVRGEETNGTRLWEFGMEVYKELLKLANDEDYGGDYTDVASGRDFTLEVEKQMVMGREVNKVTSIRIKPKASQLSQDATLVEKLLTEQPDILGLYKKHSYDELKTILQKWIEPEAEVPTEDATVTVTTDDEEDDLPFTVETKQPAEKKFEKIFKTGK